MNKRIDERIRESSLFVIKLDFIATFKFSALTQHIYVIILSRCSWYISIYMKRIIKHDLWIITALCALHRGRLHARFPVWVEVFLQRLPAFVVALVQTLARLKPPLGDRHAEGRLEHEGLRQNRGGGKISLDLLERCRTTFFWILSSLDLTVMPGPHSWQGSDSWKLPSCRMSS